MATELAQQTYSISADGHTATRIFYVSGESSAYAAITASGVPAYKASHPNNATIYVVSKTAKYIDDGSEQWEVTCNYGRTKGGGGNLRPDEPENGDEFWEIGFTSQNVHIESAFDQDPYPATAPEMQKAIGVDDKGEVKGVDILEGIIQLNVTLWKTTNDVNASYLAAVLAERDKVNSGTWYGFSAGEVLFTGFRTNNRNTDLTELSFEFSVSPNIAQANLPPYVDVSGSPITVTNGKLGWEYLWTLASEKKNATTNKMDRYYKGVYVAQVYNTSAFSSLGLSGSL